MTLALFCQVLALVLLGLSTVGVSGAPRFSLFPGGMFFWLLSLVIR